MLAERRRSVIGPEFVDTSEPAFACRRSVISRPRYPAYS
jgi:hypothetical protein